MPQGACNPVINATGCPLGQTGAPRTGAEVWVGVGLGDGAAEGERTNVGVGAGAGAQATSESAIKSAITAAPANLAMNLGCHGQECAAPPTCAGVTA